MKIKYLKNVPVFDKFTQGLFIESETLGEMEILKFIYEQTMYGKYGTSIDMNISWLDELAKYMKLGQGIFFEPKSPGKELDLKRFHDQLLLMNTNFDK